MLYLPSPQLYLLLISPLSHPPLTLYLFTSFCCTHVSSLLLLSYPSSFSLSVHPLPLLSYHPNTLTISMHYTAALHHTPLSVSLGIFGKIKSTVDGDEQVRSSPEFFMLPNSYAMIFILNIILISKVQGHGDTHQFE